MRRFVLRSARTGLWVLVVASLLVATSAVLAGSRTFSGTVTTSDTALTDCTTNYAKITPFTVTVSGSYTLNNLSPTTVFNGPTFYYASVFTIVPTYVLAHPNRLVIINNSLVTTASGNLDTGTTYYLVVGGSAGCGTTYPVSYSFDFSGPGDIIVPEPPKAESPAPDPDLPFVFSDGRINSKDLAAPVAVYPANDGGLVIYDAYNPNTVLLVVSADQIAATAGASEDTLIAGDEAGRVAVYRLADGSFQINAPTTNGKTYVLSFSSIQSNAPYTSTELE